MGNPYYPAPVNKDRTRVLPKASFSHSRQMLKAEFARKPKRQNLLISGELSAWACPLISAGAQVKC